MLNYCGVGPELLAFTVDRSPHKQGRFLPRRQIPIFAPERIFAELPQVPFRDHVWPKFLRDNARSIFALD